MDEINLTRQDPLHRKPLARFLTILSLPWKIDEARDSGSLERQIDFLYNSRCASPRRVKRQPQTARNFWGFGGPFEFHQHQQLKKVGWTKFGVVFIVPESIAELATGDMT